jgi:hypothetical protein
MHRRLHAMCTARQAAHPWCPSGWPYCLRFLIATGSVSACPNRRARCTPPAR